MKITLSFEIHQILAKSIALCGRVLAKQSIVALFMAVFSVGY